MKGYVSNISTRKGQDEFTKFLDVAFTRKRESACSWQTKQEAEIEARMLEYHDIAITNEVGQRYICKGYKVEQRAPGEYIISLDAPFRSPIEQRIKEDALVSPKAAFMQLLIEIERELRKLLVSSGVLSRYLTHQSPTFPIALQFLGSVEGAKIPDELKEQIGEFWNLRNNVVHGENEVPIRAFDLGFTILRVFTEIPRPSYIVRKANVPLYEDHHCTRQRPDVKGVLLERFGADGVSQGISIYPSTKSHYVEGMSVGWEWDIPIAYRSDMGWEATWYKDIKTEKCTPAWSESLEFIGRDVNQV
ncbi:MAG TPA: hypothetical protein VFK06_23985 [Candidatus Angelobacter sp.]|nr:hypothetical protein [Candidatus Angelobacter sp.]